MNLTQYSITGSGRLIILVHGVGLDQYMWGPVIDELKSDFTCVAFDLLGHGQAPHIRGTPTLIDFTKRLFSLINQLGPLKPVVVGFSMGAMVAKRLVIDNPDLIGGLVIAHSVFDRSSSQRKTALERLDSARKSGLTEIVEPAIQRWFTTSFKENNPLVIEKVRHTLLRNNMANYQKSYKVFALGDQELVPLVNKIRCPTAIVTGEHDINSTPLMSRFLSKQIKGADVTILKGLAHGAPIEAPKIFADVIKDTLTGW